MQRARDHRRVCHCHGFKSIRTDHVSENAMHPWHLSPESAKILKDALAPSRTSFMPLVSGRRTPFLHLALLAIIALLVTPTIRAQENNTPPLAGVAHVAIRVKDLAASRAFYEKLGFQQAFDLERNGVPYESFIKINDHQFIELYPVDEKNPDPAFLHVCFEGVDLNAIHDDYLSHGLTPTQVRKAGAGNLLF